MVCFVQYSTKWYVEEVTDLVTNREDVNQADENRWTLLHIASFLGCIDIVNVLLLNNAHIKKQEKFGNTPIHVVAA